MNDLSPISVEAPATGSSPPMRRLRRTDATTVVLHWLLVGLLTGSLATGFRIAADDENASWTAALAGVLPEGEILTWHAWFAYALIASMAAYVVFLFRARLTPRVSLDRMRLAALSAADRKTRLQSYNVLTYWIAFALLIAEATTGTLLYASIHGLPLEVIRTVHRVSAWSLIAYVVLHVAAQTAVLSFSGLTKILIPRAAYGMAALVAGLVAAVTMALVWTFERGQIQSLTLPRVVEGPRIDGSPSDPVWRYAPMTKLRTVKGANLPGEVVVTVRAMRDETHAFFLFEWPDDTRSQAHLPLRKTADGWRVLETDFARQDEDRYYEDKFAVMLAKSPRLAGAGTAHLGGKPLGDKPAPAGGRGLHYTTDGSIVDVWHWKSVRTGPIGQVDDNYFGPPMPAPAKPGQRYTGGYTQDPSTGGGFLQNWTDLGDGRVQPLRLPSDPQHLSRMGEVDLDPNVSDHGEWSLPITLTEPYSEALDALYPVGVLIPSVIIQGPFEGDRGDVKAVARWYGGAWHLEISRKLDTGSQFDVPIVDDTFLWVAVFNHSQTRHSWHLHPLRLRLN